MLLGLALYPTYRVRVRAEYLQNPSAISRVTEEGARASRLSARRNEESRRFRNGETTALAPLAKMSAQERQSVSYLAEQRIARGAKLVRWFDVKEHWSALGLLLAFALVLLTTIRPDPPLEKNYVRTMMGLALFAAAIAWSAALIGILLSAARSVAAL